MFSASSWGSRAVPVALACALLLGGFAAAAHAKRPARVPASYFGVAFTPTKHMSMADQEKHFRAMAARGIRQVRVDMPWRGIEPDPPQDGKHTYDWGPTDRTIAALARNRLRPNVVISTTPGWAETRDLIERLRCHQPGIRARRPVDIGSYAALAGAVARRYGHRGTFWSGARLPVRPIARYFLWNEPNTYPNWCPAPDPAAYANLVAGASRAIRSSDRRGQVVLGALPDVTPFRPPEYFSPGDFLAGMRAAQPGIGSLVDAVGINAYWFSPDEGPMDRVRYFRDELRRGGIPDSEPMLISEVGWPTLGPLGFSEQERASRMRRFTRLLPRSNCNVPAVLAHTWITNELDPGDSEDWYGLASPSTGALYPAGREYATSLALFRGRLRQRAPRKPVRACPGMPLPDRDRDGVPDHRDRRPLNPKRR